MQQITPNSTSLSGHRHFVISCESPIRPHKRSTNRRWQKAKQYVPKTFTKFHHENEFLPLWANKPYYLRLRRLKMRRLRCEGLMDQLWRDLSNTSSDSLSNNYLSEPRDYSLSQQQQLQLDHQHQQQIQELRRCQYQEYLQIQQQQQLQLEQYKQERFQQHHQEPLVSLSPSLYDSEPMDIDEEYFCNIQSPVPITTNVSQISSTPAVLNNEQYNRDQESLTPVEVSDCSDLYDIEYESFSTDMELEQDLDLIEADFEVIQSSNEQDSDMDGFTDSEADVDDDELNCELLALSLS
ncbi:hypothetical protein CJJ07_000234 [Candidozyma auris]|nr:hypothetical protein CJJ07_000234 [[Candida] auris]QEL62029.1 hypothetical protein CJJ09_004194 [[Candida] auris]